MEIERGIKDKGFAAFLLVCALAVLLFSYFLFGITGIRVVLGILLASLPFYLILNSFGFDEGEKLVFSFVFGITIFPSLAYLLGLLISFKLSIFITFIILLAVGYLIRRLYKR